MSELKIDKVSPRTGTYVSLNTVGMKNIVINGDMSIFQRSTSASSLTGSGYHAPDRYRFSKSGFGTWTWSQSTDVPTSEGFGFSQKLDCTTADATPASSSQFKIEQKFEGQNLQYLKKGTASALSLTASFWVKSTKTGTFILELFDVDNTRQISKSYTVDVTDTWEKKTITFPGDTSGALDNDNGNSLTLFFWLGAGTDYSSGTLNTTWNSNTDANRAVGQVNIADSTSNDFYLTGVQLEAGTTASDFEFLPFDVNLGRCMRYCLVLGDTPNGLDFSKQGIVGHYFDATSFILEWFFQYPMRTTPSFTVSSVSLGTVYSAGGIFSVTNVSNNTQSPTTWGPAFTTSSATSGNAGHFDFGSQYAILSAEL
jgi:hypothetical protein